jgi:hypothetical protein
MQDSTPPVAVRFTRFLLWFVLISTVLIFFVSGLIAIGTQTSRQGCNPTDGMRIFAISIVGIFTVGITGLALRGIQQRRPYGRWLSVFLLVLLILGSIGTWEGSGALSIIFKALLRGELPPPKGELIDESRFDNSTLSYIGYRGLLIYAVRDALVTFLVAGLPLLLTTRLIFSKAVKRFFS